MKLVQFGDIALPSTQSKFDMPRTAVHQTLSPTGSRGGSYDLYGVQSPINDQALGYEFVFRGGERSVLDDVLGKIGRRDTLIAALYDGTRRQANAKLLSVSESTLTREETSLGLRKVKCDWTAEPYWYDDTATQVDLVATTQALVVNDGNARAIRGLKFTLNPTLASGVQISNDSNGQYLTVSTNVTSVLVIDCGAQSALMGATNVYANTTRPDTQIEFLSLEPGLNVLRFSVAVSGQVEYRSCWL